MPSISTVRAANAGYPFPSRPVALFVGGTSGIGQGTAEAFARHTKGNAHIIICGRNRAAAEAIIASFPSGDGATHEFVECDVSLMRNVHRTAAELVSRLPKLNYLVMSTGFLNMKLRDETEEGIDRKLAVYYYSRWVFVAGLIPLFDKAAAAGEDAKVLSVLAAGMGGQIDAGDLGLKKTLTPLSVAFQAPTYLDLMNKELALRHPSMAFTHAYPGIVRTPVLKKMVSGWYFGSILSPLLSTLTYPLSVSRETCGENMLYALLQGSAGAWRRTANGDDLGQTKWYGTEEEQKALWEHTHKTVNRLDIHVACLY